MPRETTCRAALITALGLFLVSCGSAPAPERGPVAGNAPGPDFVSNLDGETYEAWRSHVWPSEKELAWEEIPWLPNFRDGVLEADAQGKPLLTWVMNGHPLGCT